MIPVRGRVTGVQETNSALSSIPSLLRQAAQGAMVECLELLSTTIRQDFLEGPYPEEIQSRTGSFRRTFRRGQPQNIFRVEAKGTMITGTFGSEDQRARILNDGGIIRPTRSQYLAVRTDFTKTAGGVVRAKYQQPLRGLPNTFVRPIRAPKAKAAVFERLGKRVIPIAWLVKEVFIRGRHYLDKGLAKASPQFVPIFQKRFDQVIDRFNTTIARLRH